MVALAKLHASAQLQSGVTCEVPMDVVDAIGVGQSIRSLVRNGTIPAGLAPVYERVARQMISAARLSVVQGAPAKCTTADHEAIKLDDAAWSQLAPGGTMDVPESDEPAYQLELATCPRCRSTIARKVKP
jgi:hypothetical protein